MSDAPRPAGPRSAVARWCVVVAASMVFLAAGWFHGFAGVVVALLFAALFVWCGAVFNRGTESGTQ